MISDIEGEVAENPIFKDSLYVGKHQPVGESDGGSNPVEGMGAWIRNQEYLSKILGFNLKIGDLTPLCTKCHQRPVRRGEDGRYPSKLDLCEDCYLVHRKEVKRLGDSRWREIVKSRKSPRPPPWCKNNFCISCQRLGNMKPGDICTEPRHSAAYEKVKVRQRLQNERRKAIMTGKNTVTIAA